MASVDILEAIKIDLKKAGNAKRAQHSLSFFKTGPGEYGEGDKFLGVTMPAIRVVVRKYWDNISVAQVSKLLSSIWHEERMAGLLILIEKFGRATAPEKAKIYHLYLKNIKGSINNWDLVDLTAPRIVGMYLIDKSRLPLYKLAVSKNLWERRVAILSTFCYIYSSDGSDALKISALLLKDRHDLIHKAVGWMLREVGKRCDTRKLEDFLAKHAPEMPRTMLRYAIEKLPLARRKYWLNFKL